MDENVDENDETEEKEGDKGEEELLVIQGHTGQRYLMPCLQFSRKKWIESRAAPKKN